MFLVFAGEYTHDFYREGGWKDYIEEFYQEGVAVSFADKIKSQYDWVQVVDSDVKKVILEY